MIIKSFFHWIDMKQSPASTNTEFLHGIYSVVCNVQISLLRNFFFTFATEKTSLWLSQGNRYYQQSTKEKNIFARS